MAEHTFSSMSDVYSLKSYWFDVPDELIARYPVTPRDHARLMIVEREKERISQAHVYDLPDILAPQDALIFNDSKVVHAALQCKLDGKKAIECLLIEKITAYEWLVLAKPARLLKEGSLLVFAEGIEALVVGVREEGKRILRFSHDLSYSDLERIGSVPLPPYLGRKAEKEIDEERYQTIYGKKLGSIAAPTAGLHFTNDLFDRFKEKDISTHFVTLHVGTGTFLPIRSEDIHNHKMHHEAYDISQETACRLNNLPSLSKRVAVGTTSCRVLETVVDKYGKVHPQRGVTNLFVYPGYKFRFVNSLFTNFHTPGSSLLTLVAAFMGYDLMVETYRRAIEQKFRFFSYGDALLIL